MCYNEAMWFLLGYLFGRSSRHEREPSDEPWTTVDRGVFVLILGFAALAVIGTVWFFLAAWVEAHGIGETALTAFWFLVGIPVVWWVLHRIGLWAERFDQES